MGFNSSSEELIMDGMFIFSTVCDVNEGPGQAINTQLDLHLHPPLSPWKLLYVQVVMRIGFFLDFYDSMFNDVYCKTIISCLQIFHGLEDIKHYLFNIYPDN